MQISVPQPTPNWNVTVFNGNTEVSYSGADISAIEFPYRMTHTLMSGVLQLCLPDDLGAAYTAGSHIAITHNVISNTKPAPTWVIGTDHFPSMQ